jgi:NhaP-type Na+/H+ or K+/H+ antiporter
MNHLLRVIQILFSISLVSGFWLWWMLDHVGHGYRPESGFLRWWHDLEGQPEFLLLLVQLAYPLNWWLSRNLSWSAFWRTWRTIHLALVLLLLLAIGLAWLATPDLGGHWG